MLRLKRIWEGKKRLADYLEEVKPKKVALPFGHGLGDMVMFMNPFNALCKKYPEIEFTLILQKGLGFEELKDSFSCHNGRAVFSGDLSYKEDSSEFDIIADIDFPMSEGQIKLTKGEYCCVHELGIDPVCGHKKLDQGVSRLVGVHFQITCLPGSANVPYDIAKKIWNEIKDAGYIPIETLMQHVFHNPVNKKYDFIDRHLRDIPPRVSTLIGVMQSCSYFICCVSGNFHTALSIMPAKKICLIEKDFKAESFTRLPINKVNVKDYKGGFIKDWLTKK